MYAFLRGFRAVEKRVFFAVKHVLFSKVAILLQSGEGEVTITAFLRADMSPKAPK
jgi:hypothetical protein